MNSSRPYLIRALYEWIVDNDMTPYLLVNAMDENVRVPEQFIEDGKIVLNISPTATQGLGLGNELIEFSARFSGAEMTVSVPSMSVLAIYARENGQGMMFAEEEGGSDEPSPTSPGDGTPADKKPTLTLVK
ncbi:ClpXP protease specificity-enhancing factor [Sulfuriflexus sp.]|uniref:ClpXP protease specificity-enhancing factor n=1 Tax=Sulfuriflexus sp. TaxID=2015443 RepID=UPI0028CE86FA|nr:ClpXP protease specificity-enhancing factor [Sulfuriflexus sp.]MDT8403517.1 ClpXP protease specificity-enhancing factor [Sulfuriflexus sp.]